MDIAFCVTTITLFIALFILCYFIGEKQEQFNTIKVGTKILCKEHDISVVYQVSEIMYVYDQSVMYAYEQSDDIELVIVYLPDRKQCQFDFFDFFTNKIEIIK